MERQYTDAYGHITLYFTKEEYDNMTAHEKNRIKAWFKWHKDMGLWISRKRNIKTIALNTAIALGFTEKASGY
jgi:hypothetical protein